MVYKIVWTLKALESYINNLKYLEQKWTESEVKHFTALVERKLKLLSQQPAIGTARSKSQPNLRRIVLHKRIALIYRTKPQQSQI
jgi:plasmid stabilization system protein ParE